MSIPTPLFTCNYGLGNILAAVDWSSRGLLLKRKCPIPNPMGAQGFSQGQITVT